MNGVHCLFCLQLVFSSTCAVYGNPEKLPVTEETPTNPINPYGKAKLAAEQELRDYAASNPNLKGLILRYFNVFGSDPEGLLGEYPPPELRKHTRISGACMEAALHEDVKLTITGAHPV
jgi:UDP-arabinose 4-epimerase